MIENIENEGLPEDLKDAIERDHSGKVKCPICMGEGYLSAAVAPKLKVAWDAISDETIKKAIYDVVHEALAKMKDPPAELHRRYRLTRSVLESQKRVRTFEEAASVIRRLGDIGAFQYVVREIITDKDEMVIDVLFRSKAAVEEGVKLFGMSLEVIEEKSDE